MRARYMPLPPPRPRPCARWIRQHLLPTRATSRLTHRNKRRAWASSFNHFVGAPELGGCVVIQEIRRHAPFTMAPDALLETNSDHLIALDAGGSQDKDASRGC